MITVPAPQHHTAENIDENTFEALGELPLTDETARENFEIVDL